MVGTTEDAYKKINGKYSAKSTRHYTPQEIQRIVEEGTPVERAELSNFFFQTDGLYKRIIW